MHEIRSMLDQVLGAAERMAERDPREARGRARAVAALFQSFREHDAALAEHYVRETWDIPWPLLALSVKGVIRGRVYPSLPTVGELWQAARALAGMDREQYDAGRYVAPPKHWPPIGRRWSITAGHTEPLPEADQVPALLAGDKPSLPERA